MFWNRRATTQLIKRQTIIFGGRLEPPYKQLEKNASKTIEECNKNDILRVCNLMLEPIFSNYPVEYLEFCVRRTLNKVIAKKKMIIRIMEAKKNDRRIGDNINNPGGINP
jgi:hypothetical protein